jgi:Ca2+-binding EF-hand superfamily protein
MESFMLTSKNLGLALAALIAAGAATPAIAQGAKPDPRLATFKANDKNKDGKLAKDEFSVVARSYGFGDKVDAIFPQADANKDSFLQDAEFLAALDAGNKQSTQVVTAAPPMPAGPPPELAAAFKANDKNNDGKLSKTEFTELAKSKGGAAKAEADWTRGDKDKDGFLTQPEFFAASGAGPVIRISGPIPANAPPAIKVLASFKDNDKNTDGKLDKTEFQALAKAQSLTTAQADEVWTGANKDKDAFLTEQELVGLLGATPGMQVMRPLVGGPAGAPAPGQQAAATDEQRFAAFKANDKNKDGKLTKAEYAEVLKVLGFADQLENYWTIRDANKDGFITEAEYKAPIGGTLTAAPAPPRN